MVGDDDRLLFSPTSSAIPEPGWVDADPKVRQARGEDGIKGQGFT